MNEGTLAKPQEGVSKMKEVSGATGQVGGDKQPLRGGVYRHKQNKEAEIIALDDPITGDAAARGAVRAGYEWVRDVKEGDIKVVGLNSTEFAAQPERKLESDEDMLKGLRARLSQLEAEADKRKEDENKPQTATELSQKLAQEAAEQKTDERGTDNSGDVASSGGVNAPLNAESEVDTEKATENEEVKSDEEGEAKRRPGRPTKESK